MLTAFWRAFAQLADPAFRAVLVRAAAWSAGVFAALLALAWGALMATRFVDLDWLETLMDALGGLAALVIAFLLFPAAAAAAVSFFLEDIARAVEARHYPAAPPPRPQGGREAVMGALRLALLAVGLNALALPVYALAPGLNVFVFYGMNGYLVGREYFDLVGCRRLAPAEVRGLWRRRRVRLWLAGVAIAFLASLPVVGWSAPALGVAVALHLFERLRASGAERG